MSQNNVVDLTDLTDESSSANTAPPRVMPPTINNQRMIPPPPRPLPSYPYNKNRILPPTITQAQQASVHQGAYYKNISNHNVLSKPFIPPSYVPRPQPVAGKAVK
jgi:hypothetical protein